MTGTSIEATTGEPAHRLRHSLRRLLRRELRARRRAVPPHQRAVAAQQVARQIERLGWLRPGRRIGLYLAMPEELDTAPLLRRALQRGCIVALPRVVGVRQSRMRFYDAGMSGRIDTASGAFGLLEPRGHTLRAAAALDVVFVPLVGFDAEGHRLGMGRGFYDRHFAHRRRRAHWKRPLLIGIAYDVQEVAALETAPHDVCLDAIVTESTVRWFRRSLPA